MDYIRDATGIAEAVGSEQVSVTFEFELERKVINKVI